MDILSIARACFKSRKSQLYRLLNDSKSPMGDLGGKKHNVTEQSGVLNHALGLQVLRSIQVSEFIQGFDHKTAGHLSSWGGYPFASRAAPVPAVR